MWWVDHSRKSRVIGLVKDMTKSDERAVVDRIVSEANAKLEEDRAWRFGEFVAEVYFPYYSRKWKTSTRVNNMNRVSIHLVDGLGPLELSSFRRDGLQDLLDEKTQSGLSFSTVDHLRWDLKQIFDMALAEGLVMRNPALLLFTPKEAAKPVRRVMTMKEVQICFAVLGQRERLIAKLAIMAGMRPGEIFALTWVALPQPTWTFGSASTAAQSIRRRRINRYAGPLYRMGFCGKLRLGGRFQS